ncbi:aldo/keto reductase, partial [archaeon]
MGLGTMMFGDHVSEGDSVKILDQATKEYGMNLLDCSELNPAPYAESMYGLSDKIVGSWLKKQTAIFREGLVISAKLCAYSNDITWPRGGQKTRSTRDQVFDAVNSMLSRLQTPYID